MLQVNGINAFYGLSHVLHGVSFSASRGETVCLLGRNGAGKSTSMKTIMGLVSVRSGEISYSGRPVTGMKPFEVARLGIGYIPEDRRIFPDLTVRQNLEVARKNPPEGKPVQWDTERIYEVFTELRKLDRRLGMWLSGGEQQMLSIARALMGNPDLLLLDEPSEGLAPVVVKRLKELMAGLCRAGITILLAEQNLSFIEGLAGRVFILDKGMVVHEGTLKEVLSDEALKAKYLSV